MANALYMFTSSEQPLSVHALVYDLSGRLVFSGEQTVFTYDNRTEMNGTLQARFVQAFI